MYTIGGKVLSQSYIQNWIFVGKIKSNSNYWATELPSVYVLLCSLKLANSIRADYTLDDDVVRTEPGGS